jgi:PAS domain S-box-containing protein
MSEKIKILLIEDNPGDANLIHIHLKEAFPHAFELDTASYLRDGLELIKKNKYDIIIIDLSLPDSSGLDTFREVYNAAPEVAIMVLTGLEDEDMGITTVKMGAQDFLVKGKVSSKTIRRSINYSIERYKLLKSLAEKSKMLEEKTADLFAEKQKLAQAQKLAHVGSWEWSVEDDHFSGSEELYRILKLDPAETRLSYQTFLDFVHPNDRDAVIEEINKAIKRKRSFDYQNRIIRKDGTLGYLHGKGEVIADKKGKIVRVLGTAQDITQRKKEEQLEQLAMVAIKSFNAVTIADREGRIEWVNEGFTRLFGYKLKDVKGTYGEILRRGEKTGLSPDNEYYKMLLREKKPLAYENKNYSKSGEEYWVLTSLTPLLNEKGEVEKIISIDSDITRRKRAEQELIIANKIAEHSLYKGNRALEELHRAKKEVEESLKVKEQFLANMSHEIRTPMNAIIGFTNLLLKKKQDAESTQYLNAIKTSGQNLLVIINDILDFSKLESGKITIEQIPFKLSHLITTVVDLMLPKAVEKDIKLSYSIEKEIPDTLVGDPTRLNQILLNLVGNAVKFTKEGGVKVDVSLMNMAEEEVALRFSVTDTGIGIPAESTDKIFEGFTQASNDTTRKYGGTGLGLTITKELVELQGGEISVKSKVGEGSSFIFWLKFKKDTAPQNEPEERKEQVTPDFPLEGIRVLLVEDNLFNQMLAAKILENWHCKVDIADNGVIAVEKAEKQEFDLVLMDIQLPEMDGYQATSHIRTKLAPPHNAVPIIAMTAHAFAEESEKCRKFGMDDYISKPFDESKLYTKLVNVLSKHEKPPASLNGNAPNTSGPLKAKNLVDLSYLKKISKGETEFMLKMIDIFLTQTPTFLAEMEKQIGKHDVAALRKILHRMKPSAAFMGIGELGIVTRNLENDSESPVNPDQLPLLFEKIKYVCTSAIEQLEEEKRKLQADKG